MATHPIAQTFRDRHPAVGTIDLLIPDINGIVRGKRIPVTMLDKALTEGVLLPRSVFALDICGDTVETTGLGGVTGDQDYACLLEPETLAIVPWSDGSAAQCMMGMFESEGVAFELDPREILRRVVAALTSAGLFPTVAVELEFYLFRNRLSDAGMPQLLVDPVSGELTDQTQCYSMDDLDTFAPFIERVQQYCDRQSVPASAAIAEYAPGQFEINLHHCDDPLRACDDAIGLKRIVRVAASEFDMTATFMAKPIAEMSGSGMHVHVSLYDPAGGNRFATRPGEIERAVGGLQATMADAMLLFAPHANSYRRFREHCYVPLRASWGYNNRTVAIRVPAGSAQARRLEHRVAGADANPYLTMAAVLGGILKGYRESAGADEPVEGDAAESAEPDLPLDWNSAIDAFAASDWVSEFATERFRTLMTLIKRAEFAKHKHAVSPLDIRWYFRTV